MNYDGSFKDVLLLGKGKPIETEKTNYTALYST